MTSQISGPCCDSDIKPDQYKSLMKALLRQTHCVTCAVGISFVSIFPLLFSLTFFLIDVSCGKANY